ncbi:MAG TPA: hypothetical protein VGD17_20220 [Chitinophagaceae bacterium]
MEKKQQSTSEEIDLLYFFRPIGVAFRRAWAFGMNYLRLLAFNRYLFTAILILGAIAGYCLRFVIPPSYKTEAIFISDMLPGNYCITLLENLNELRRPGNIPILAKELNISADAAWQIRGIKPYSVAKDTFIFEKRDTSMSVFRVSLVLSEITHLEEIQKGLINYLENNEYARRRKEARARNMNAQIAALDIKLKSLDSLRQVVNSSVIPRSQGQGIILGEPIDPVSVYQAESNYLKEQLNMKERLSTMDHIEVIQPFFKLNEHNNPNYDKMLTYAFALTFLFALAVVPLIGKRPKRPVVQ